MVGYIVLYMEPPILPSVIMDADGARPTVVEAAEGRLHIGGWWDEWFHIWYNMSYHIWPHFFAEINDPSGRNIDQFCNGRVIAQI